MNNDIELAIVKKDFEVIKQCDIFNKMNERTFYLTSDCDWTCNVEISNYGNYYIFEGCKSSCRIFIDGHGNKIRKPRKNYKILRLLEGSGNENEIYKIRINDEFERSKK